MSSAAVARPAQRVAPTVEAPPGASTPQLLKQGMYASVACAILMLIAVASGARSHRLAIQLIGRDTTPGIIAAQHVSAAMADMDASAVNELLFSKDDHAAAGARQAYDKRRKEAAEVLIAAAENIRYEEERQPIRTLAWGLSSYAEQIQRARDLRHVNDAGYIEAYRAAVRTMAETLLPAALELDHAKRAVLDRTYADQSKWSSASMLFLVLSALALCGVLMALQVFLTRRVRRVINPLLLMATGVTVFAFFYFAESFNNADNEIKVAKQDAFESIHLLWKARSAAYGANADESRYLLDSANATSYELAFKTKADNTTGYLAAELAKITLPNERAVAEKAIAYFADYRKIDLRIRALERSGQHAAAISLCTGESNVVFDKFDQAIEETLEINQAVFEQSVKGGFDAVNHLEAMASVVCGMIALMAVLGLLPRLREYSAA